MQNRITAGTECAGSRAGGNLKTVKKFITRVLTMILKGPANKQKRGAQFYKNNTSQVFFSSHFKPLTIQSFIYTDLMLQRKHCPKFSQILATKDHVKCVHNDQHVVKYILFERAHFIHKTNDPFF